jgi:hypothetical protein
MHWTTNCPMEPKEKKAINTNQKRYSNCFGNHEKIDCFTPRCQRCRAKHHTALCAKKETRFGSSSAMSRKTAAGNSSTTAPSVRSFLKQQQFIF